MRINWEEFEETLQELHEELNITSSNHEDFIEEFTEAVDELIEDYDLQHEDAEKAVSIARRYGYLVAAREEDEDYED